MLLQGLHALFLGFQVLVAWEFLIKGIELRPDVIEKYHFTDVNRHIYPYLTVWNLVVHIAYLGACGAEDVMVALTDFKSQVQFKTFSRNRAFLFETVVFPGSLTVVTFYWSLILMDPLYLFPGPIEDLIPSWINFLIHSGVGIFAISEMILRSESWSPYHGWKRIRVGSMIFSLYALIICAHRYLTGAWIYPFIEYLSWPQRVCLFFTLVSSACIFYYLGYSISSTVHGKRPVKSKYS